MPRISAFQSPIVRWRTAKESNGCFVTRARHESDRKYTKTTDRDAQDAAYGFATTFVERPPRLPYKAVETILAQIAEKDPRAKAHKPDDFIDPIFYNELVKSGFFKNASR